MAITQITADVIADGTVVAAEIADNAITLAKMAGGTDGNIISYDASGDPVAIATGNDGQVLTSTGAGSPPAFEAAAGGLPSVGCQATLSAAQDIVTGTWTKINLNTEGWDFGSDYDSSTNYRFTAPSAGKYIVSMYLSWNESMADTDNLRAAIYFNGVQNWPSQQFLSAGNVPAEVHTFIVSLASSKYLEMWVYHDNGSNRELRSGDAGTRGCHFVVQQLSEA